jgi:predicted GIY-YIG superfamily endonuclease
MEQDEVTIIRFVDDILVLGRKKADLTWVRNEFIKKSLTLNFTEEKPKEGFMRFSDLKIGGIGKFCWEYDPRKGKPILHNDSSHSRIVKHGVIKGVLINAAKKSCEHQMKSAVKSQMKRITAAGYSEKVREQQTRIVVKKLISGTVREKDWERMTTVVIPFFHGISNRLKKFAAKYNIRLVFSFPHKLSKVASSSGRVREKCSAAASLHQDFVKCETGCVYIIPLTCGKMYAGQTGKCVNERLTQHARSLSAKESKGKATTQVLSIPEHELTIKAHSKVCGCEPIFKQTRID